MSWLFGIVHKKSGFYSEPDIDKDCYFVRNKNLFFAVNKGPNSLFSQSTPNNFRSIVGVPIIKSKGSKKLLNQESFFKLPSINSEDLFGHFVSCTYSKNKLEIYNDIFGLRDLFYLEAEGQYIFSTRIDLINLYTDELTLNPKEFSSLWLTQFQLSTKSIFNEIKRLGPAGKITIENNKLSVTNKQFEKSKIDNAKESFEEILSQNSIIKRNDKISLALSGGIDCRLLLSHLLKDDLDFSCHTYINEEDKDLKISKKICNDFGIEQKLINRELLNISDIEQDVLNYYKSIQPVIPFTQLLDFGVFGKEYLKNKFIIDGGYGEFYRRQFYSRLFLKGFEVFNSENISLLANFFLSPKPKIFNSDFYHGLISQVNTFMLNLVSSFDTPKNDTEFSDILDLTTLRFKLSNVYGAGQTILDNYTIAIMPMAQKDTINAGLNISPKEKMYSRFIKDHVKYVNLRLSQINLVKDNLENPFYLSNKITLVRLYLYRKYLKKENYQRYAILQKNKEFILDILNSQEVINNSYLSSHDNQIITEQFFNGDLSKGNYLDWLLTFVFWAKANRVNN